MPETKTPAKSYMFVVRRDRPEIFQTLRERLEQPCRLHVEWDRRVHERRAQQQPVEIERRRAERRTPPGTTWTILGFVLVPRAGDP